MPALNVYITDELKERMSRVEANWSEICRRAIEIELLYLEGRAKTLSPALVGVENWTYEYLEPTASHSSAVIKPYLHKSDSSSSEVKVLSDFYTTLIGELGTLQLKTLQANFGDLMEEKHRADVLFPGRDWLSGNLGVKVQLVFKYPVSAEVEQPSKVFEGELVELSTSDEGCQPMALVKREISSLIALPPQQLDIIATSIDIEPELIEYSPKRTKVPTLDSEVYSAFRKAWNEVYESIQDPSSGDFKPPSSTVIKRLWKNWYEPEFYNQIEEWGAAWEDSRWDRSYPQEDQKDLVNHFYEEFLGNYSGGSDWIFVAFVEFVSKFVFDGELLDISKINPSDLNSLSLEDRDNLPPEPGIYFVLDSAGEICYIGMSVNLQKRWLAHHRQEDFERIQNCRIAYIPGLPIHYLKDMEATLIQSFLPRLNIKGKVVSK